MAADGLAKLPWASVTAVMTDIGSYLLGISWHRIARHVIFSHYLPAPPPPRNVCMLSKIVFIDYFSLSTVVGAKLRKDYTFSGRPEGSSPCHLAEHSGGFVPGLCVYIFSDRIFPNTHHFGRHHEISQAVIGQDTGDPISANQIATLWKRCMRISDPCAVGNYDFRLTLTCLQWYGWVATSRNTKHGWKREAKASPEGRRLHKKQRWRRSTNWEEMSWNQDCGLNINPSDK